jgi:hypothetical protein
MKNNQEQTQIMPPIADFMQQPYWDSKDKIEITGNDFEILYNFTQMFGPAVDAARRTMQANINTGVVKTRYVKEDGTEVGIDHVKAYQEKFNEYMEQMKAQASAISNETKNAPSNIVNMQGEPVSSESAPTEDSPSLEAENSNILDS